ncbi:hypothetical protein Tco_0672014 [Tanacetum coccineum]
MPSLTMKCLFSQFRAKLVSSHRLSIFSKWVRHVEKELPKTERPKHAAVGKAVRYGQENSFHYLPTLKELTEIGHHVLSVIFSPHTHQGSLPFLKNCLPKIKGLWGRHHVKIPQNLLESRSSNFISKKHPSALPVGMWRSSRSVIVYHPSFGQFFGGMTTGSSTWTIGGWTSLVLLLGSTVAPLSPGLLPPRGRGDPNLKKVEAWVGIHGFCTASILDLVSTVRWLLVLPVKDSNSYLKSRGSIEDFVSFREMITSQLQGKLWLYDEVRTRLCLFCHHQIGEDCWDS